MRQQRNMRETVTGRGVRKRRDGNDGSTRKVRRTGMDGEKLEYLRG